MRDYRSASIVAAGALIAAGLFFGLRTRHEAGTGAPPAAPMAEPSRASPMTAAPARDLAKIRRDGAAAVGAFRDRMVERCWRPALARHATPATSRYLINSQFTSEGIEIARGISEVREVASRPDVAQCLRSMPLDLRIPPPGAPVRLELPIEFP